MKKILNCILVALLSCTLNGCNSNSTNNNEKVPPIVDNNDEIKLLSKEEILSMSNYMNGQKTIANGAWIYGISFNDNGEGVLSKIKNDGTELTKLSKSSSAYINVEGGWIYYLAYDWSNENVSIKKIRISGEEEKTLIKSDDEYEIQCMFIYNDNIYFAKNYEPNEGKITGKFYRSDLDGNNVELILDKAVYYPYIVNDRLYYQDDNDDCKIHVANLDGTDDKILIDKVVFRYITDGQYIYYQTTDKEVEFDANHNIANGSDLNNVVERCNIDGTNQEKILSNVNIDIMAMNDTTIYYTDANDEYRLYSFDIATESVDLISQDNFVSNIALFDNEIFYYDGAKNFEYVDNLYLADLDGTYKDTLFTDW